MIAFVAVNNIVVGIATSLLIPATTSHFRSDSQTMLQIETQ